MGMIRPSAALMVAPVFGAAAVPVQLRIIIAMALSISLNAAVSVTMPEPLSVAMFLAIAGEIIVGLGLGLIIQTAYSAASIAGEIIGNAMGLGFANMVDPSTSHSNPALSQLLTVLAAFLFFAADGHLLLIQAIRQSYEGYPIGIMPERSFFWDIALFGRSAFNAGFAIAVPVAFAVVLIQIIMGMLSRSAPQLNLFAVGLPAATLAGFFLMVVGLPVMAGSISAALSEGFEMALRLSRAP
jgi:flagellar biosynthesis protein FliR